MPNIETVKKAQGAVSIATLKLCVADCLDVNQPVFAWGPPGIGKSQAVAQVAAERGAAFTDIRLSMFDPVDLRGLPSILAGDAAHAAVTVWNRPAIWPTDESQETVLFLDELDRAAPAVLNAALQIVLDRRIGEHKLPETVRIVAAGNGASDRGTSKMPGAADNRFLHLECGYDETGAELRAHFEAIGVDPLLIAFNHLRPELGYTKAMQGERAFATPRQWEAFNRFVKNPRRMTHGAGLLGRAVAMECETFLQTFASLPSPREILANPETALLPSQPGQHYAVASALARLATVQNFAAVQTYLGRMPKEWSVVSTVLAVKRDATLQNTGAFIQWAAANQDVVI